MAVALASAASFVLGKDEGALSATERNTMQVLLGAANSSVSTYLRGSPCPADVVTAATLRMLYYDWWSRYARRPAGGDMLQPRFRRDAPLSPLRASGAMALLSPHKRRSVGTGT